MQQVPRHSCHANADRLALVDNRDLGEPSLYRPWLDKRKKGESQNDGRQFLSDIVHRGLAAQETSARGFRRKAVSVFRAL